MRDRQLWLRHSNELIGICDTVRARFYKNIEEDTIELVVLFMILKGVRTFRAIRLLYMKGLEEQAQTMVRVLFEAMVELKMFILKCSEDPEDAIRRVRDSLILQNVRQAKASGWAGFGLFELDPKELLGDEA